MIKLVGMFKANHPMARNKFVYVYANGVARIGNNLYPYNQVGGLLASCNQSKAVIPFDVNKLKIDYNPKLSLSLYETKSIQLNKPVFSSGDRRKRKVKEPTKKPAGKKNTSTVKPDVETAVKGVEDTFDKVEAKPKTSRRRKSKVKEDVVEDTNSSIMEGVTSEEG